MEGHGLNIPSRRYVYRNVYCESNAFLCGKNMSQRPERML